MKWFEAEISTEGEVWLGKEVTVSELVEITNSVVGNSNYLNFNPLNLTRRVRFFIRLNDVDHLYVCASSRRRAKQLLKKVK